MKTSVGVMKPKQSKVWEFNPGNSFYLFNQMNEPELD